MIITGINCSFLDSPSNSDDDKMNTGISKSTRLEPKTKQLVKETRLFCRAARNLVRRIKYIRPKHSFWKRLH